MATSRFFTATDCHAGVQIRLVDPQLYSRLLIEDIQHDLELLAARNSGKTVTADFRDVSFCPTTLIGCLVHLQRILNAEDRQLVLCGMNEVVRAKLRALNLEGTVFQVQDEAAV